MEEERTTYYQRHRERILAYEKARREANPERNKEYQKEYYQKNKDKILSKHQERRQKAVVARVRKERPAKAPKPPADPQDKRKLPRPYMVTEKDEPQFGFPQKPHQVKKMLEICPQGFYQPPPSSNPFVLTF